MVMTKLDIVRFFSTGKIDLNVYFNSLSNSLVASRGQTVMLDFGEL